MSTAKMVAIGAARNLAATTSLLASEHIGINVELVSGETGDWYLEKMRIGAECKEPTVLIDADLVFRLPCDFEEELKATEIGVFHAALARYQAAKPVVSAGLSGRFLNTGLMVFGPSHQSVFRRAIEIYKSLQYRFYGDEGPVNIALHEACTFVRVLPEKTNVQVDSQAISDSDIARHYSGSGWLAKALRVRQTEPWLAQDLNLSGPDPSRG